MRAAKQMEAHERNQRNQPEKVQASTQEAWWFLPPSDIISSHDKTTDPLEVQNEKIRKRQATAQSSCTSKKGCTEGCAKGERTGACSQLFARMLKDFAHMPDVLHRCTLTCSSRYTVILRRSFRNR